MSLSEVAYKHHHRVLLWKVPPTVLASVSSNYRQQNLEASLLPIIY